MLHAASTICFSGRFGEVGQEISQATGKTRARAARDMGVAQTSIFNAEESPHMSLLKLRIRMIEKYSPFKVSGPVFHLNGK